jgi:hypothetical protein
MDVESAFKNIRNIFQTLSGTSGAKVSLTYVGLEAGVTKPWQAQVDAREAKHETANGALNMLHDELKKELLNKASSTESEAQRLRKFIATLGN